MGSSAWRNIATASLYIASVVPSPEDWLLNIKHRFLWSVTNVRPASCSWGSSTDTFQRSFVRAIRTATKCLNLRQSVDHGHRIEISSIAGWCLNEAFSAADKIAGCVFEPQHGLIVETDMVRVLHWIVSWTRAAVFLVSNQNNLALDRQTRQSLNKNKHRLTFFLKPLTQQRSHTAGVTLFQRESCRFALNKLWCMSTLFPDHWAHQTQTIPHSQILTDSCKIVWETIGCKKKRTGIEAYREHSTEHSP